MFAEPQEQHHWLQKLVGSWTFEGECCMGADQPPMKTGGSETVRSLGGLWVLCDGASDIPGGGQCTTQMTLGYDPAKKKFLGTFVASMMTHLWLYHGTLDDKSSVLTLDTDGPSMSGDGTMVKYQDVIELVSDTHRTLTSRMQVKQGTWQQIMKVHYRKKAS